MHLLRSHGGLYALICQAVRARAAFEFTMEAAFRVSLGCKFSHSHPLHIPGCRAQSGSQRETRAGRGIVHCFGGSVSAVSVTPKFRAWAATNWAGLVLAFVHALAIGQTRRMFGRASVTEKRHPHSAWNCTTCGLWGSCIGQRAPLQ